MGPHFTAVVTVLTFALGQAGAGPARATPPKPPGAALATAGADAPPRDWTVERSGSGYRLTWRPAQRLPLGDAEVEFFAGDRLLGRPTAAADRRAFRLDIAPTTAAPRGGLQVRAAGRRLDLAGRAATARVAPDPPVPHRPAAAVPALPEADPGTSGRHRTRTGDYTLPPVRLPGLPHPVERQAVVVAPAGLAGPRPLVLFLHGRHDTCYDGPDETRLTATWPCTAGTRPVPSQRGYLAVQRLLASQGYVTLSIAANGINGQDAPLADGGAQARSSLVRRHLADWVGWAGTRRAGAPPIVRSAPPVDLSRVLLVGHSRGGEGVNRAAIDTTSPPAARVDGAPGWARWRIRGTVLIGPTIFGHNPAPDVPSVVLLPGCDGDVADQQGELYVDGTRGVGRGVALHSAVWLAGANHNYFNTEWTPGQAAAPARDDFASDRPDPVCTAGRAPARLSPGEQQAAGATYVAAAARLFLLGDDRVRPLLDGSGVRAPSAGRALAISHAVGAARVPLVLPGSGLRVAGDARLCPVVPRRPAAACLPDRPGAGRSPHFVPFGRVAPEAGRTAVAMRWSAPGRPVGLRSVRPVSVATARAVTLRLVVPAGSSGTLLDVALRDRAGHRAVLGRVRLDGLPGSAHTSSYWAQEARVALAPAVRRGLRLDRVTGLELVPRSGSGRAWLIDAWGWRSGTPAVPPATALRVDVGRLAVRGGARNRRSLRVPVRVSGRGTGQVRLFVTDPATGRSTGRLVTVGPSAGHLDVPVQIRGDTRPGRSVHQVVSAKAVRGAVVGNAVGGRYVAEHDRRVRLLQPAGAAEVDVGQPAGAAEVDD